MKAQKMIQNQEVENRVVADGQNESAAKRDTFESQIFEDGETMQFSNVYTDAVIVEAIINGSDVNRILVDTGSSVNAIFLQQAEEMGLSLDGIEHSSKVLQGFNGERSRPAGEITLPVCWGEETNHLTYNARFVILSSDSSYNCIFGRPLLNQFDAFVSTKRMMVKIPAPYGIATIRSNISEARQCYASTWNSYKSAKMAEPFPSTSPKQEVTFAAKARQRNRNHVQRSREGSDQDRCTGMIRLPLSCSSTYIVTLLKQKGLYEKPCMLRMPYERHNSETYCNFHEQYGHDTQQCYKLKEFLKRLVAKGHICELQDEEDRSFATAPTSGAKGKKRGYVE